MMQQLPQNEVQLDDDSRADDAGDMEALGHQGQVPDMRQVHVETVNVAPQMPSIIDQLGALNQMASNVGAYYDSRLKWRADRKRSGPAEKRGPRDPYMYSTRKKLCSLIPTDGTWVRFSDIEIADVTRGTLLRQIGNLVNAGKLERAGLRSDFFVRWRKRTKTEPD